MLIAATFFKEYPEEKRLLMLKDITKLFQLSKSIFQPLSWLVFGLLLGSLLVVYWLILMILLTVFLVLIWLLVVMWLSARELVLTLVGSEDWVVRLGEEKYSTQESFRFLRSLNQQYAVVLKMGFEVVRRLHISVLAPRNRRHSCTKEQ